MSQKTNALSLEFKSILGVNSVIPKWRAHQVDDWQNLLITDEDGETNISVPTAFLINLCCISGISEITEENLDLTWCRIALLQIVFSSEELIQSDEGIIFLTKSDVYRHIGLEMEATPHTDEEFFNKVMGISKQVKRLALSPMWILNGRRSALEAAGLKMVLTS
jgi:hypothetical protein